MKKAFTMIELIFAIAVIGILSAIAIPKLMVNRDTAYIVKLQDELQNVRKGIEAYAGDQFLETGVKSYPQSLCDTKLNCSGSSYLFSVVSNVSIPHRNLNKDGRNFVFWNKGAEFMVIEKKNSKKGYAFSYDSNTGELKCISKNADGYESLPCSKLGDLQ